jgi:hypothetical protein
VDSVPLGRAGQLLKTYSGKHGWSLMLRRFKQVTLSVLWTGCLIAGLIKLLAS